MSNQLPFSVVRSVEILKQTPGTLIHMLAGLSPYWTASVGNTENWSPFDVLGHLIHGDETDWIPRAEIILAQGESTTFEPFDRVAQFERSRGKTLGDLLTEFAHIRNTNIESMLRWQLTPEQIALEGFHPELGKVTLAQLIATWVIHDLDHIRQIANYLAAKYTDNVGPWRAYLSILR